MKDSFSENRFWKFHPNFEKFKFTFIGKVQKMHDLYED
jgi:hypothetical protein